MDPWEAHIFRLRLSADGIPAFVVNDLHISVQWYWSVALGGVRVMVPNSWHEEAMITLGLCTSGVYRAEMEEVAGGFRDEVHCSKCNGTNLARRPTLSDRLMGVAIWAASGVAIKVRAERFVCRTCGTRWIEGED